VNITTSDERVEDSLRLTGQTALGGWTAITATVATLCGLTVEQISNLLFSSPRGNEMVQRLGGTGTFPDTIPNALFSVAAVFVTAFGIGVIHRAARDEPTGLTDRAMTGTQLRVFWAVVGRAVLGTTWLLFVVGTMFTLGQVAGGGLLTPVLVVASLNHAPAVWTVVAMTAVAWSLRVAWGGWGLLALFALLGPLGKLAELPPSMIDLSPYARIASMPVERFEWTSTVALTAGSCVLAAIAAYNFSRRDVG
jgi:ABC-2 type transport system permease protein